MPGFSNTSVSDFGGGGLALAHYQLAHLLVSSCLWGLWSWVALAEPHHTPQVPTPARLCLLLCQFCLNDPMRSDGVQAPFPSVPLRRSRFPNFLT